MSARYTYGGKGYVVREAVGHLYKGKHMTPAYWFGAEHGWGTTWGSDLSDAAVYATKGRARGAWEHYPNRPQPHVLIMTVADAENDMRRRGLVYGATLRDCTGKLIFRKWTTSERIIGEVSE